MKSIGVKNMIDIVAGKNYLYIPSDSDDKAKIKYLLIGHSVEKINENTLKLDNGIELEFEGNDGCGGCGSGDYDITELNECKNIITNVEFKDIIKDKDYGEEHCYQIFVYAENKEIKLLQCDGDDGNGWYGTGYHIIVKFKSKRRRKR